MTEKQYDDLVYSLYEESFLKIVKLHETLIDFEVGDIVYSRGKLYLVREIELDWTSNKKSHKNFTFYSRPEIRITTTLFYHKKDLQKGNNCILWYPDVIRATEEQISAEKQKYRAKINKQRKTKRDTDPLYRMECSLRARIRHAFVAKNVEKVKSTQKLIGVDYATAKKHIERSFTKGMGWHNYGEWEIDHIIPFASAKDEKDLLSLCHYSNLQALWRDENRAKSDTIFCTQINIGL